VRKVNLRGIDYRAALYKKKLAQESTRMSDEQVSCSLQVS